MAQIAHVRRFDGTDDWIRLTSTDFVTAMGALTFLAIAKTSIADGDEYRDILIVSGGTGGQFGLITRDAAGAGGPAMGWYGEGAGTVAFEQNDWFTPAMGWCLIGFTKADGTATPRLHRYQYDSQTWTHTDLGSTIDESNAASGTPNLYIGTWNASIEFFKGDIAVVGAWMSTALNDTQIESLAAGISAWDSLSPTGLWLLNQPSTSDTLLDRIGNGDQVAINGTTAVAESGLAFDVGAGAATAGGHRILTLGVG